MSHAIKEPADLDNHLATQVLAFLLQSLPMNSVYLALHLASDRPEIADMVERLDAGQSEADEEI